MAKQSRGLAARLMGWLTTRRRKVDAVDAIVVLDRLNEHLARDVGLCPLRSAGPRRPDPWL